MIPYGYGYFVYRKFPNTVRFTVFTGTFVYRYTGTQKCTLTILTYTVMLMYP